LYASLSRLEMTLEVGSKFSYSWIFSGFTSNSPHEVVGLKGSWLNLCIVSSCCSELGSFFFDPDNFLDFIYCLEFYPHFFFIFLLLEQQSPCRRSPDFDGDYDVCATCELSYPNFIRGVLLDDMQPLVGRFEILGILCCTIYEVPRRVGNQKEVGLRDPWNFVMWRKSKRGVFVQSVSFYNFFES